MAEGYSLSQSKYVKELLSRGNFLSSRPILTPIFPKSLLHSEDFFPFSDPILYRSLVTGVQYLTFTRPDIAFVVNQVSHTSLYYSQIILQYLYAR